MRTPALVASAPVPKGIPAPAAATACAVACFLKSEHEWRPHTNILRYNVSARTIYLTLYLCKGIGDGGCGKGDGKQNARRAAPLRGARKRVGRYAFIPSE